MFKLNKKLIVALILLLLFSINAVSKVQNYNKPKIDNQLSKNYFAIIPQNTESKNLIDFFDTQYNTGINNVSNILVLTNKDKKDTITGNGLIQNKKTLKSYFSNSKIHTLNIQNLDIKYNNIKNIIQNYNFKGDTLFISSIDFKNDLSKDFSKVYKKKILYKLNNQTESQTYNKLSNQETKKIKFINNLAVKQDYKPFIWKGSNKHFVYYKKHINKSKELSNGVTLVFYGDLIYDRSVKILLESKEKIKNHFSGFQNKKLLVPDYAGLNLETPVIKKGESCMPSGKSVKFCSEYKILPILKDIGFNLVNLANNHSMDSGVRDHKNTIQNLKQSGINYFGYVRHGKLFERNYVYTGTVRNIKTAFHGFDFSITPDLQNKYCDIIKNYDNQGFVNILSLHWGIEYSSKPTQYQKDLAYKLIDCGGDIIIGHGPHVTQPTEVYKDRLIVYSLGNFLFDQYFSEPTQKGFYILADIKPNGEIQTYFTGDIRASPNK